MTHTQMLAGYMDTHLDDAQYTNGCTLDIWIHTYTPTLSDSFEFIGAI